MPSPSSIRAVGLAASALLVLACEAPGPSTLADADADAGGDAGDAGDALHRETCWPIVNTAGLDTGFDDCVDGAKRRRAAMTCPTEVTFASSPCRPSAETPSCASDAECTAMPLGYCANAHKLAASCGCYYGCRQDSDCGAGSICECGSVVGRCVPATCVTNADCGAGLDCLATLAATIHQSCTSANRTRPTSYTCQTASDQCHGGKACPSVGSDSPACLMQEGHRACGAICSTP